MPRRSPQAGFPHRALGLAIRHERVRQQLTQEMLAIKSGFDISQLSSLERGKRNPTFRSLKQLSRGLGVPLWQLVQLAEKIEEAEEDL
jgi:transcriptional regulator with XRE-family HTH domain